MSGPECRECIHMMGRLTCGRPIGSHWNPATNQRRSRLNVQTGIERSNQRSFLRRRRCGPEGFYFEPRFPTGEVVVAPACDTVRDGDGGA